jgi:hypothetical protein
MRYRHSQVLELATISKDTLRYWKEHLGPLRQKDGRSQSYTFAEVVAIGAVADAAALFGLSVERLGPMADQLFKLVAKATEPGRDPGMLLIGLDAVTWRTELPQAVATCTVIVPLGPVVARIRGQIAVSDVTNAPPAQYDLPIPGQRVVGLRRQ